MRDVTPLLNLGLGVCDKFLPHFIEMKCSMTLEVVIP
jgi:hypothetical protein